MFSKTLGNLITVTVGKSCDVYFSCRIGLTTEECFQTITKTPHVHITCVSIYKRTRSANKKHSVIPVQCDLTRHDLFLSLFSVWSHRVAGGVAGPISDGWRLFRRSHEFGVAFYFFETENPPGSLRLTLPASVELFCLSKSPVSGDWWLVMIGCN